VPLQFARNVQFESYKQNFTIDSSGCLNKLDDVDYFGCIKNLNRKIDQTFGRLVGDDNWRLLKDKYGLGPLRDELLKKQLNIEGVLNMYLSLDSSSGLDKFLLEGSGWFYLQREQRKQVLMTGNFKIIPKIYELEQLSRGFIDVPIELLISSIPGEITHRVDSNVIYRIKIARVHNLDSVYIIDYDASHPVFMPTGKKISHSDEAFAQMTFDSDFTNSKVIDLRGRNFLRRDYQ
jgi:hypothetical protein